MALNSNAIFALLASAIIAANADGQSFHPRTSGTLEIVSGKLTFNSTIFLEGRTIEETYSKALQWPTIKYSSRSDKSSYRFKPFIIRQSILLQDFSLTIELSFTDHYLEVYFKDIIFKGEYVEDFVLDQTGQLKDEYESKKICDQIQEDCKKITNSLLKFLTNS